LTIANAHGGDFDANRISFGAGIENNGTLTIQQCVIRNNSGNPGSNVLHDSGAGIYNRGTLMLVASTLADTARSPNNCASV
jgi:hypothetical protein